MTFSEPGEAFANREQLPLALYSAAQCRELDRIAIEERGIAGISLMKRAARAAFQTLRARWPDAARLHVFCGAGNNAGDGYIVAALAAEQNMAVRIVQVAAAEKLSGDAARAYQYACQAGVEMQAFDASLKLEDGLIVDALLGTGAQGAPRENYAQAIRLINACSLPVLSLDLPSGLDANSGHCVGECVHAQVTVTFIGLKRGLFTGRGPAVAGRVEFADLQIPQDIYSAVATNVYRTSRELAATTLAPRAADAHKGKFGHVLVVGGNHGTGGAALMAAEAAARVGSGLVSVATRPEHGASFLARRPELMVSAAEDAEQVQAMLARATVVVVGPGLGQSDWARTLLQAVLASGLPVVADADALNLLSSGRDRYAQPQEWVLTPHPGEAARLLKCSVAQVQEDRFAAVEQLQSQFGAVVVLKGAGSLVASPGRRVAVADAGNPGMASGGMGDILSGVLGGLLAQGLSLSDAAEVGTLIHGQAADLAAAAQGQRGLLATDLLPYLQRLVNP